MLLLYLIRAEARESNNTLKFSRELPFCIHKECTTCRGLVLPKRSQIYKNAVQSSYFLGVILFFLHYNFLGEHCSRKKVITLHSLKLTRVKDLMGQENSKSVLSNCVEWRPGVGRDHSRGAHHHSVSFGCPYRLAFSLFPLCLEKWKMCALSLLIK